MTVLNDDRFTVQGSRFVADLGDMVVRVYRAKGYDHWHWKITFRDSGSWSAGWITKPITPEAAAAEADAFIAWFPSR